MRAIVLVFCLLAVTACDEKGPTGPTVPVNRQFTLAPGEAAVIEGTGLRVQFVNVTGDSRCPADALCIWVGDAVVHVRVLEGARASDYQLHTVDVSTTNPGRATVTHDGTRIVLMGLQPYPFSNRPIQPADYRASMEVRR